MAADDQRDVIAFLAQPAAHGDAVREVERHETHGSIVFLAGEFAYKLKRGVRFPYMDYSTPLLRRRMCEKELLVNRRTAPGLYLEVRPLVRDDAGVRWGRANEADNAIDWVLVMRRFAQGDLFEEMRKRGRLTRRLMLAAAETIASFHAAAEIVHDGGGANGIASVIEENLSALAAFSGDAFPPEELRELAQLSRRALRQVAALLDRRREEGMVRICHGDLHLNNICVVDGRPVPFDAIEFNDAFTKIDVFYDLAFLLMDLMRHGLGDLASAVLNRYLEQTWDYGALAALPLFLSCRAGVRAHVAMSHPDAALPEHRGEAREFLRTAIASLQRDKPQLIAVGGVSGTGKSTLAYALAPIASPLPGAVVLRSDLIRKWLFGVAETERLPESAYSREMNGRVYTTLTQMAGEALRAGTGVIADAVFGEDRHRQLIEKVAQSQTCRFTGFWLEAPEGELAGRLARRRGDASDATVEVLRRQLAAIEAPRSWRRLDASAGPEACAAAARAQLKPQAPAAV